MNTLEINIIVMHNVELVKVHVEDYIIIEKRYIFSTN